jgi:hypothetical protein
VTLSGAATAATTTDPSGRYSFGGLANGSYTVTPSRAGYTFSPTSAPVTVSGADATQNFTATAVVLPPSAPTGLTATARSSTEIELRWNDNANNEVGFEVQMSLYGVNFGVIATLGANARSHLDTSRSPFTLYSYRVRAYNSAGYSAFAGPVAGGTLPVVPLPRTGQVISYAAHDDGDTELGAAWPSPRFTPFDFGYCVVDQLTGLMWPANGNLAAGNVTWQGALGFVADTMNGAWQYCGFSDWRLPNRVELASLQHYGVASTSSWLNGVGFNNVGTYYWSSTGQATDVLSSYGLGLGGDSSIALGPPSTASDRVLAVRGSSAVLPETGKATSYAAGDDGSLRSGVGWSPGTRFTHTNSGYCIVDRLTGLMWPADGNLPNGPLTWQGALDFATDTMNGAWQYCGFTDWRLPNVVEVQSLFHMEYLSQAGYLNNGFLVFGLSGFTSVEPSGYWTSTTSQLDSGSAYWVSMGNGQISSSNKGASFFLLPVRSASPIPPPPLI